MDYKLIAIDLDGTLLNDEKKIPYNNRCVLKKLDALGIEIVIATGRRYWSAKELTKELKMNLVIMSNNGNIARRSKNDEIIVKKYLDLEDFYTLIKLGKSKGLHPVIHVDHYHEGYDMIIELDPNNSKYSSYMEKNMDRYKKIDDFLNYNEGKVLAVCYVGDIDKLNSFERLIKETYPDKYSSHVMSRLTIAGGLLEIMHPMGSKWLSLKDYALEKGINPENIIAIGDDNNDIEMIKNAGLGIGMKNAADGVKKAADIVTEMDNNKGGVGEILSKIFNI